MNTEKTIFSRLLCTADLYSLYSRIGKTLITPIDLKNISFDMLAVSNSVDLLSLLGFIEIKNGKLIKKGVQNSFDEFKLAALKGLKNTISDQNIFEESLMVFDDEKATFYVMRNSIPLRLSGLVMLLDEFKWINILNSRVYILNPIILDNFKKNQHNKKRGITLIELKNKLLLQDKLGEVAENLALIYEKNLLIKENIHKNPIIISNLDVAAGYDIASYMHRESQRLDKFIEVKSCSDSRLQFYMTNNEIEKAKFFKEAYFLYLLNRDTSKFTCIQDPYNSIIKNSDWRVEPSIFQVAKID